jgi:SAM-dependent methyltransferase
MPEATPPNDEQHALWNGQAGQAWVATQAVLDRMFEPFEHLLAEAVADARATRVLDIGCGAGATTLAVARQLGPTGHALGVDISQPMIAAAQARTAKDGASATFACADAQTYPFEPGGFDAIVSRFGVMFFEDPVAAFTNLRRAASPNAALRMAVWRSPADNPFMTAAERVAAPLLPDLPPRRPGAPGQFGFADPQRVRTILDASGWGAIDIQPLDVVCRFPADRLDDYLTRLGPVGQALQRADEATRARVLPVVRAAFDPFVQGDEVVFTAACWMIRAGA